MTTLRLLLAAPFTALCCFASTPPDSSNKLLLTFDDPHSGIRQDSAVVNDRETNYVISRIHSPVTLDGLSNEPAWQGVRPLPMVMHGPTYGGEPSEKTEVRIAYDQDFLYVAARLYDREPEKIQSISKKRDDMNLTNDWFGIILDTFNDHENGLTFFTTPDGLRLDFAIMNDAQGDSPINSSWNTFWDVATARTAEGWFAEMRIPFSSIRFQEVDGRVVMGFTTLRLIARKNETDAFPTVPPNWGFWSPWKPSQAQNVMFEGISKHTPLYITPYVLGGIGESYALNSAGSAYEKSRKPTTEAGLDLKYGITDNFTVDLTANTDFAQVEADDEKINLTRFSLFFPEKRLFFQERSNVFDFHFDGDNRLFYSRRIGIQDGKLVRIFGGARTIGRIGPWDLGFLYMRTASTAESPSENFVVTRVTRQLFNAYSRVGGIVTSRTGTDGSYNLAFGIDGMINVFGNDFFSANAAQTFFNGAANRVMSLDPSRIYLDWQRRTIEGPGYDLSYSRAGKEYAPGIGYETRDDYTRIGNRLFYGWIPGGDAWLLRHMAYVDGSYYAGNADGRAESYEINPAWQCDSKEGYSARIGPKFSFENVPEEFSLSDRASIPAGAYHFAGIDLDVNTPNVNNFFAEVSLFTGSFYDGRRFSVGIYPQWNISSTVNLMGTYEFTRAVFPDRDQTFIAHLARFRVLLMLSTSVSMGTFVQYSSVDRSVTSNFRFRYNPSEGVDFYIVYDEGRNADRMRLTPELPVFSSRTLLVKYSYTFDL